MTMTYINYKYNTKLVALTRSWGCHAAPVDETFILLNITRLLRPKCNVFSSLNILCPSWPEYLYLPRPKYLNYPLLSINQNVFLALQLVCVLVMLAAAAKLVTKPFRAFVI